MLEQVLGLLHKAFGKSVSGIYIAVASFSTLILLDLSKDYWRTDNVVLFLIILLLVFLNSVTSILLWRNARNVPRYGTFLLFRFFSVVQLGPVFFSGHLLLFFSQFLLLALTYYYLSNKNFEYLPERALYLKYSEMQRNEIRVQLENWDEQENLETNLLNSVSAFINQNKVNLANDLETESFAGINLIFSCCELLKVSYDHLSSKFLYDYYVSEIIAEGQNLSSQNDNIRKFVMSGGRFDAPDSDFKYIFYLRFLNFLLVDKQVEKLQKILDDVKYSGDEILIFSPSSNDRVAQYYNKLKTQARLTI